MDLNTSEINKIQELEEKIRKLQKETEILEERIKELEEESEHYSDICRSCKNCQWKM